MCNCIAGNSSSNSFFISPLNIQFISLFVGPSITYLPAESNPCSISVPPICTTAMASGRFGGSAPALIRVCVNHSKERLTKRFLLGMTAPENILCPSLLPDGR